MIVTQKLVYIQIVIIKPFLYPNILVWSKWDNLVWLHKSVPVLHLPPPSHLLHSIKKRFPLQNSSISQENHLPRNGLSKSVRKTSLSSNPQMGILLMRFLCTMVSSQFLSPTRSSIFQYIILCLIPAGFTNALGQLVPLWSCSRLLLNSVAGDFFDLTKSNCKIQEIRIRLYNYNHRNSNHLN